MFWTFYIVSEYFANLMHIRSGDLWPFFRATMLSLPALMLATYVLAWYAVPKYLMTDKWLFFLAWVTAAGIFIFFARLEWQHLINYLEGSYYGRIPASKMLKNIIRDYAIVALAVCISMIGDYRQKQRLNQQLAESKAEAEIKLLKGQLHPHFLFNSLNNIYSLALIRSDLTADSILKLTELLDYLIYRANLDRVPLLEEVALLENYIGLEQLRHDDRLQVETDLHLEYPQLPVAPLILLPFAENCFKHGGPGSDHIFRVKAFLRADTQELNFQLQNSRKPGHSKVSVNGGIGLENIRQRLHLLYPGHHNLTTVDNDEQYEVKLKITF